MQGFSNEVCTISIEITIYQELPQRKYLVNTAQDDYDTLDHRYCGNPLRFVGTEVHQTIFHLPLFLLPLGRHPDEGAHPLAGLVDGLEVFITQQLLRDLAGSPDVLEVFLGPKTDEEDVLVAGLPFCHELEAKVVDVV